MLKINNKNLNQIFVRAVVSREVSVRISLMITL